MIHTKLWDATAVSNKALQKMLWMGAWSLDSLSTLNIFRKNRGL